MKTNADRAPQMRDHTSGSSSRCSSPSFDFLNRADVLCRARSPGLAGRSRARDLQGSPGDLAHVRDSLPIDYADDNIDGVLFETLEFSKVSNREKLTIDTKRLESLAFRPMRHVRMKTFSRFH